MKDRILELKEQGKTYREIQQELGCSLSTISYYCGNNQKEKTRLRVSNLRKSPKYVAKYKADTFIGRKRNNKLPFNKEYIKRDLNHKQIVDKILESKVCYLSGRKIDLSDGNSYHLDHIDPYCVSENSSVDNMGVACTDANMSKSYLSLEEYIKLCKDVLEHNGYKVYKK